MVSRGRYAINTVRFADTLDTRAAGAILGRCGLFFAPAAFCV